MRSLPLLAWLAALLLAAGCAQPPAEASVDEPTSDTGPTRGSRPGRGGDGSGDAEERRHEADPANVTRRALHEEFGLQVTAAVFGFSLQCDNAALVEGAPFEIVDGTVTLTWDAQSALTEQLALHVQQQYGDHSEVHEGPSPLVVELDDLPEAEAGSNGYDDQSYLFSVQPAGIAGAAYEQAVQLVLDLEYESAYDAEAFVGC